MPRTLLLGESVPFDGDYFLVAIADPEVKNPPQPTVVYDYGQKKFINVTKTLLIISVTNTTHQPLTFDSVVIKSWRSLRETGLSFHALGCKTIIELYPGLEGTFEDATWTTIDREAVDVPVFELSEVDYIGLADLTSNYSTVVVWIGPDETNYQSMWTEGPGIVYVIITAIFNGSALAMSAWPLVSFIRAGRLAFSVPIVCLSMHLIASLLRFLWSLMFIPQRLGILRTALTLALFYQVSQPLLLGATLLIVLYWNELIATNTVRPLVFLERFRIPYLVSVGISFGITFSASVIAVILAWVALYFYFPILLIQVVPTVLVVWIYGFRVRRVLQSGQNHKSISFHTKRLIRATTTIMLSALMLLGILISAPVSAIYVFDPVQHMIGAYWSHLLLSACTVLQTATFRARRDGSGTEKTKHVSTS